jgi:hypothetical protein
MSELAIITPSEWQAMTEQANALVKSGFLPKGIDTPQKAVAIMLLGRELGIPAWTAFNGINVIQGKPTVSPQLMLAMINRSGLFEDMRITSDINGATCTMKRKGRAPHTETFTAKDAAAMGLMGKDNYLKQPATMFKWRVVSACARVVYSDVILALYTPEEMGADVETDDQGNMTIIEVKTLPPPALVAKTESAATMQPKPAAAPAPVEDAGKPERAALPTSLGELKQRVIVEKQWVKGDAGWRSLVATLKERGEIQDETDYGAMYLAIERYKLSLDELAGMAKEGVTG